MRKLNSIFLLLSLVVFWNIASAQKEQFYFDVTVESSAGRPIKNLSSRHFRLSDNGKPKEIKSFFDTNSPMSIGFLVDVSGSISYSAYNDKNSRINWSRRAVLDFVDKSRKDNEYLIITFAEHASMLTNFTDGADVRNLVSNNSNFVPPKRGQTRFHDALAFAIGKMAKGRNQKKILIVLTDGEDNKSTYSYDETKRLIGGENVPLFFFDLLSPDMPISSPNIIDAETRMRSLADISGGRLFIAKNPDDCTTIANWIVQTLENQYRIGFEIERSDKENKWRKIDIELNLTKEERKLVKSPRLYYRKGYYPLSTVRSEE